jgi:hypothetical protein
VNGKKILREHPMERLLEILTQDNDEGQRLRQSAPFVGILSEKEGRAKRKKKQSCPRP